MPILESLATAVPEHRVPQSAVRDLAAEKLEQLAPELLEYLDVFDSSGIEGRNFARPLDWFLEPRGWTERNRAYAEVAREVGGAAARRALDEAGVPPSAVDGIIFVSTTGIATPSLDARLANDLGLRSDVSRTPVWGLGCGGGVAGLGLAEDLARAHPDKRYLLVSLELCSLQFMLDDLSTRAFVAAVIFGDGAAAAVVRGDQLEGATTLGRIKAHGSHLWPGSENVMGWNVEENGLGVVFSRRIPDLVERDFAPIARAFLKEHDVVSVDARLDFHPGGRKVIDAYAAALKAPRACFDTASTVLRNQGNMSSPTVLFVLKESLERRALKQGEASFLAALGPGFAAELALIEGC